MIYGQYKKIRDAARQCLIDYNITELPVRLELITNSANIEVRKNSICNQLSGCESGAAFIIDDQWYIVYDDETSVGRQRLIISHELGHIFLGHDLIYGFHGRSFDTDNPKNEIEADMFAIQLLSPSCVLKGLDLHTAEQISNACRVTMLVAQNRAERMEKLYKHDNFDRNHLEQVVYEQFKPFIENNKGRY